MFTVGLEDYVNTVINDDCLHAMASLPDDSIDSIVTDPPYGLSFMGKDWDHGVPGVVFWEEALRIAKPGCHLLAFGGTRTFHRLAVAIEDAGWEIRDTVMWVYGCLSEDTEILTINGWEHYHRDIANSPVLCYDIDTDSFVFDKPERSYVYENEHTAYRIESDKTDQLVSRNHRCIVERSGRKVFAYAETLECEESVPFLESLHDLPETIPNIYEGTSVKKQDLLKRVQRQTNIPGEKGQEETNIAKNGHGRNNMCCLRKESMETQSMAKECSKSNMLKGVQRGTPRQGLGNVCTLGTSKLDREKQEVVRKEDGWQREPCMERRGHVFQQTRQLQAHQVRAVSGGVCGDGQKRRVCDGTQAVGCNGDRQNVAENGSCASRQPRPAGQPDREPSFVQEQQGPQDIRSTRSTRTTLAKVTPTEYRGRVWCVGVKTGAFVARRNGKIFITGNSGFPKSMDVSKAIDKQAGAEREVVGPNQYAGRRTEGSGPANGDACYGQYGIPGDLTAPATPEACQWEGYGTALKPAWEPVIVARKPFKGTVANNVLKWGTGALNIDGCRVGTEDNLSRPQGTMPQPMDWGNKSGGGGGFRTEGSPLGRFPANLIHSGEPEVVGLFPVTTSGKAAVGGHKRTAENMEKGSDIYGGGKGIAGTSSTDDAGILYGDSGSASRFFYCAKASKSERNMGCEGLEEKETNRYGDFEGTPEHAPKKNILNANNHPTVKPLALMRYLCRLVTPPDGVVLDPFCGSGSTLVAALQEGFRYLGIEKDPDYVNIAYCRTKSALKEWGLKSKWEAREQTVRL